MRLKSRVYLGSQVPTDNCAALGTEAWDSVDMEEPSVVALGDLVEEQVTQGFRRGKGASRTLGFIIQDMSHGLNSLLSGTREVSPFSLTTPMSSLKFLFSLMSVIIRLSHGHWSPV